MAEDQFFKKASEYARHHGLPRVYIACNSGARVGLVEELLPKLRIHWKDVEDPAKADLHWGNFWDLIRAWWHGREGTVTCSFVLFFSG